MKILLHILHSLIIISILGSCQNKSKNSIYYDQLPVIDSISEIHDDVFKTEGILKNGKKDGLWKTYLFEKGDIARLHSEVNWVEGKKQGYFKSYHNPESIEIEGKYENDSMQGEWKYYYKNGLLSYAINWNRDKKNGIYKRYNFGGVDLEGKEIHMLTGQGYYLNGKKDSLWIIYHQGGNNLENISNINRYKDGKRHGLSKSYYNDGTIKSEWYWKNGIRYGIWKTYHKNGELKLKQIWTHNGELKSEVEYSENGIDIRSEWSNLLDSSQMTYPKKVRDIIMAEKLNMKGVSNPMVAKYKGSEFGDYFYFFFTDGIKNFDFGSGNNNLGSIPFTEYDTEIKSKLIGKEFIIHWEFTSTTFNCCEGGVDLYQGNFPSIVSIDFYTYPGTDSCNVSIDDKSMIYDYSSYKVIVNDNIDDVGENIQVYNSQDVEFLNLCSGKSFYFVGIVGDFLILDSGTGSVRGVHVIDLVSSKEIFTGTDFGGGVKILDSKLIFYDKVENINEKDKPECSQDLINIGVEFLGYSEKLIYDLNKKDIFRTGIYKCQYFE